MMAILLIAELLLISVILMKETKRYAPWIRENGDMAKMRWLLPFSLFLLDKTGLLEKYPKFWSRIHYRMITLYGTGKATACSKMYISQCVTVCVLILLLCTALGTAAGNDPLCLYYGLLIALFAPLIMMRNLDRRILDRKRQMLFMLPEVLNKIVLLVNAGENVQEAIVRSIRSSAEAAQNQNPLLKELQIMAAQLENQYPFARCLEQLSTRCRVQEVTIFTTTVLMNYRRGGEDLVLALRNLSHELWEKRKAMTRTLGEEASSKLVFPMVLIFLIVMMIIAAPAILMMNT